MVEIGNLPTEQQVTLGPHLPFVDETAVAAGASGEAAVAYTVEAPEGYLIGVMNGTNIAPELRDANGEKLDGSTRVTIQKCDKQGNPLGDGIVFTDTLDRFDYNEMRNDPDYFRKTQATLMLDEFEMAKVYVEIPAGANDMDGNASKFTVGDDTSDYGKAVEVVDHDDLAPEEKAAVKAASQKGGN